jgi:hypothetical protein
LEWVRSQVLNLLKRQPLLVDLAVAGIVTDLAREFLKDGDLTLAEVDEVFKKASKGKGGK